jgi:glycine cleavage system H protein
MEQNLEQYRFSKTHEWVLNNDGIVTVGISEHAGNLLGDLVYIEFPEVGDHFNRGDDMLVVESVKAASDVYAPLSGEIVEINDALQDNPGDVNGSPYQDGWLVKLKLDQNSLEDLLTFEQYDSHIAEEA